MRRKSLLLLAFAMLPLVGCNRKPAAPAHAAAPAPEKKVEVVRPAMRPVKREVSRRKRRWPRRRRA